MSQQLSHIRNNFAGDIPRYDHLLIHSVQRIVRRTNTSFDRCSALLCRIGEECAIDNEHTRYDQREHKNDAANCVVAEELVSLMNIHFIFSQS